jgi:PPK2 family polyphosphate:nucleotide phosphotransferase
MELAIKVKPGEEVALDKCDPNPRAGISQDSAANLLTDYSLELGDLQELLYAAHQNSVLIILQGMDTSGKDGTIKRVMSQVNPLGCRVESFKVPTEEELDHDFLWRVHRVVPRRGILTIFNRSHYEDVVVARVHDLVPKKVWRSRYEHINDFEQLLSDCGTIILKFFLHISRDEQKGRLEEREMDAEKAWKLSAGDWRERKHWDKYMRAYEDALARCSTEVALWRIIPANKKWFRNLAVADVIVSALRPYRKQWEKSLRNLAEIRLAELRALREAPASSALHQEE